MNGVYNGSYVWYKPVGLHEGKTSSALQHVRRSLEKIVKIIHELDYTSTDVINARNDGTFQELHLKDLQVEKNLCINCKPVFGDRKIGKRLFQSFINVGCFSEKREKFLIPIWGLNSFIQLSTFNAAVLSEKLKNIVTFRLHPVFTKETREVFLHCVRDKKKKERKYC